MILRGYTAHHPKVEVGEPSLLTSRVGGRAQSGQLCAFGDGADRGQQTEHKHASEGPFVIDRDLDIREIVQRAEAVEQVRDYVAHCRNKVSQNADEMIE